MSETVEVDLPSNADSFPVELDNLLSEILPSDDPLDDPNFNPIDYINKIFPNGKSFEELNLFLICVRAKS